MLATTLAQYLRVLGNCTVVVDRSDRELRAWLEATAAIVVQVDNRVAPRGMGDSLAAGIGHISRQGFDACLIALADMPWIRDETLQRLVQSLAEVPVVVPVWDGRWGHPVGFAAKYYPELCRLSGDRGARAVLQRHMTTNSMVVVPDPGVVQDVDTTANLRR
jgi:molybdenum cofactor cytidylyltransferase